MLVGGVGEVRPGGGHTVRWTPDPWLSAFPPPPLGLLGRIKKHSPAGCRLYQREGVDSGSRGARPEGPRAK